MAPIIPEKSPDAKIFQKNMREFYQKSVSRALIEAFCGDSDGARGGGVSIVDGKTAGFGGPARAGSGSQERSSLNRRAKNRERIRRGGMRSVVGGFCLMTAVRELRAAISGAGGSIHHRDEHAEWVVLFERSFLCFVSTFLPAYTSHQEQTGASNATDKME